VADKTVVTHKNFKAWKGVMDLAAQMSSIAKTPNTQHFTPRTVRL
jgi:hypothetical protein